MSPFVKYYFTFFGIVCTCFAFSQSTKHPDFGFVEYLLANELTDDATAVLKKIKKENSSLSKTSLDSVNFLIASNYYKQKVFDSVIVYIKAVDNRALLVRSTLLLSYSYLYTGKRAKGDSLMNSIEILPGNELNAFINYQKSASALLNRNWQKFDSLSKMNTGIDYRIANEKKSLLEYYKKLKKIKKKSPLLAGTLSAIVPGLGKYYAGYRGKAITSFMPNLVLGTVTAEILYRDGIKAPALYVFGSLFTTFYVGNIVGSVYSVKIHRAEDFKELDNEIFFDIYNSYNRYK